MNILEIFWKTPEQHLFVQHRIDAVKTFASCTRLFNNISKKKQFTESFLGKNCVEINGYLSQLYSKEFFPLVQLSVDFHKGDKRKVTEDPYFKHIKRTQLDTINKSIPEWDGMMVKEETVPYSDVLTNENYKVKGQWDK